MSIPFDDLDLVWPTLPDSQKQNIKHVQNVNYDIKELSIINFGHGYFPVSFVPKFELSSSEDEAESEVVADTGVRAVLHLLPKPGLPDPCQCGSPFLMGCTAMDGECARGGIKVTRCQRPAGASIYPTVGESS